MWANYKKNRHTCQRAEEITTKYTHGMLARQIKMNTTPPSRLLVPTSMMVYGKPYAELMESIHNIPYSVKNILIDDKIRQLIRAIILFTAIAAIRYIRICIWHFTIYPDSKVHGPNMGPTWALSAPRWAPMLAPWTLLSGQSSIVMIWISEVC